MGLLRDDLSYIGSDPRTGKHIVNEQLYPESRGWKVHEFDTEQSAREFIDKTPEKETP